MREAEKPHLELLDLSFSFSPNQRPVLESINLQLEVGDRVGILGPSGSGKSTFLKLVAGLLKPTAGSLRLEGESVDRRDRLKSRILSRKIAMSFQKGGLLDSYNAFENIDFALKELTDLSALERRERALHSLDQVGLANSSKKQLKELSGGMLKRLSLACVFAIRPVVLLLDDPTAGLDPITSGEIVMLIKKFCETHSCLVIFSSSDPAVSFQLSNKLMFLWNSHLSALLSVQEFRTSQEPAIQQFIRGDLKGPLTEFNYA